MITDRHYHHIPLSEDLDWGSECNIIFYHRWLFFYENKYIKDSSVPYMYGKVLSADKLMSNVWIFCWFNDERENGPVM